MHPGLVGASILSLLLDVDADLAPLDSQRLPGSRGGPGPADGKGGTPRVLGLKCQDAHHARAAHSAGAARPGNVQGQVSGPIVAMALAHGSPLTTQKISLAHVNHR